jgi:hypothetical protein
VPASDPKSVTGGAPFILTQTQNVGERQRRLFYLFPNGDRRVVTIDTTHDTPELREQVGRELASGKRVFGH